MPNSQEKKYFLKSNVALEALLDGWYAWTHLISPMTFGLQMKNRHFEIMESYLKNPKLHAMAVSQPAMLGGPFIDYKGERVDEIKKLMEETSSKRDNQLKIAKAINDLNDLLLSKAKGASLDQLYQEVPEILKGFVELFYDLNNNPNFRFFEALMYKSEYYDEDAQSIALQLVNSDHDRSFILSTPRLESDNSILCHVPFKSTVIDELFKLKRIPGSYDEIQEKLGVTADKINLFESFFTEESPKFYKAYTGEGVRTRYFGHACILIETKNLSILVDPVISYDGYKHEVNRYTINDLPDTIDYVLITHNHQDHIIPETLLQLRHKIKNIVVPRNASGTLQDPSIKLSLNAIGFNNIIQIDEMEEYYADKFKITGIPFLGEHSDLDIRSKLCYHVSFENEYSALFVADSCNHEQKVYERVHEIIGDTDFVFLGMECDGAPASWLYGPYFSKPLSRGDDQSRRLRGSNYQEGYPFVNLFKPKHVFVYAMGLEPWLEFISSIRYNENAKPILESNKLIEEFNSRGISAERLFGEKTIEY